MPPSEHTRLVLAALRAAGVQPGWRILDVGCGNGTIIHRLRTAGFHRIAGLDPYMQDSIVYANGLQVTKGELVDAGPDWDLITMHHSLEHVLDPAATLATARSKLAPGGKILIRVPTVSSLAWDLYGVNWYQLDAPRHLFLFSRKALDQIAEAVGLRRCWSYDDSTELQFIASEQYAKDIPLNSERSYLRSPAAAPFSANDLRRFRAQTARVNREGRGDQMVILLERT
jgi:SAM-dependent methyltransferase